jgi:hypothetical protein
MINIKKEKILSLFLILYFVNSCGSQDFNASVVGDWNKYLTFERDKFTSRTFFYGPLPDVYFVVTDHGNYTVDDGLMVRVVSNVTVTPLKDSIAADLNQENACGNAGWSVDQPIDVSNCVDSTLFVVQKWSRSDRYEVRDNMLQIGSFVVARR